jgi:hypothetical protein
MVSYSCFCFSSAEVRRIAATVIVRRPLSLSVRTVPANLKARPAARHETPLSNHSTSKSTTSAPAPYKTGFGFILGGAPGPRTPDEREHLRRERLAFFRRARDYKRKNLPKVKLFAASAATPRAQYTREYVGRRTSFHRVLPSPTLLAPPATNYGGQVLSPDVVSLIPEIHEHAPFEWDEWHPTRRPEHSPVTDRSMLFVPSTSSFGNLSLKDQKRYFPQTSRGAHTSHTDHGDVVRAGKTRLSKVHRDSRRRL